MQQKVQFVATVLHTPELIILDEPFSGFDPVNADIIKNEILELNKQGSTFIFSTHRMESVEELCDHIALIHQSKKILDGSVKDIKEQYRNNTYWVEYQGNYNLGLAANIFNVLETEVHAELTRIKVQLQPEQTANQLLAALLPYVAIHRLDEVVPTMNDIFIEKVKQDNHE